MSSVITELKGFQKESSEWMLYKEDSNCNGGLLLNDTGTGKSIVCLSTMVHSKIKGLTLVVCPAGLVNNWIEEIKKHTNISESQIVKYYGKNRKDISFEKETVVVLTSYSILAKLEEKIFNQNFERIILDEAHYIRNTNTRVYKSVIKLGDKCINAKKWIVTATPIFNDCSDCFAYFKFLELEGIETKSDWNKLVKKNVHGLRKLNELLEKYSYNLKKENVLKELKNKVMISQKLDFTNDERLFYDALKDYSLRRMNLLVNKIKNIKSQNINDFTLKIMKRLFTSNILVFILRLKQACNSPMLIINKMEITKSATDIKTATECLKYYNVSVNLKEECPICYNCIADYIAKPCGHKCCKECWNKLMNHNITKCPTCRITLENVESVIVVKENIGTLSKKENDVNIESSKINKLIELTKKILSNNEKVVIVSQYTKMLDLIKNNFTKDKVLKKVKNVSLRGDVTIQNKNDNIKQFTNDTHTKICFLSLMSSAEGINLVSANHLIMVDIWWNEAKMSQIAGRIDRIGQKRQPNIYKLIINDSIEQNIIKLVHKKKKITELVNNIWSTNTDNYDSNWIIDMVKLVN